jgi:hypothetical protein
MNKRQAAIQAGYAPSTASIMPKRLTDKITCNRIFIDEAQRQGLTVEAIISEIKRGMTEAAHPQHPDQPDNFNRRGYADMALRIYGGYSPNRLDITQDTRQVAFHISVEDQIRAEETLAECLDSEDLNACEDHEDNLLKPEKEET